MRRGLIFLAGTALAVTAQAGLELTPGDPYRNWSVDVLTTAGYDNNVETTPNTGPTKTNRLESTMVSVMPEATLKLPGDQTSGQLRYLYNRTYYLDRRDPAPDESHSVDASLTHAFTPRLSTGLSDSFRRGIEPELVEQQLSGVPLVTRRRGDYTYNNLSGAAAFQATTRWNVSLNQSWDRWAFDDHFEADANDRDGYTTVFSTSYGVDPRTFVGGSYRFSLADYSLASTTNAERNSQSHALYATVIHRFTPLITGQFNAGAQLAKFSGVTDWSPYLNVSGTYNFAPNSTLTAGLAYNIQLTEVAVYRSAEQASSFLTLQHRFNSKLRATIQFAYTLSTYNNLNPFYRNPNDITQRATADENSWRLDTSVTYDLTRWASLFVNYTYDEMDSSLDNPITGLARSFDRHRGTAGLRLAY